MQACNKPLKTNPFTAYRDPETGKWTVVKPEQNKITDAGKLNCFPKIALKSWEKNRESQLQVVAA